MTKLKRKFLSFVMAGVIAVSFSLSAVAEEAFVDEAVTEEIVADEAVAEEAVVGEESATEKTIVDEEATEKDIVVDDILDIDHVCIDDHNHGYDEVVDIYDSIIATNGCPHHMVLVPGSRYSTSAGSSSCSIHTNCTVFDMIEFYTMACTYGCGYSPNLCSTYTIHLR